QRGRTIETPHPELGGERTLFVFAPHRLLDDDLRLLVPVAGSTAVADAERDSHAARDIAPVGPLAKLEVLLVRRDSPASAKVAVLWMSVEHGLQEFRGRSVHVAGVSIAFRLVSLMVCLRRSAWPSGQPRRRSFVAR